MTTLWFETALTPAGWVAGLRLTLADGRILTAETGEAPQAGDERAAIGLPGLPNLHSHAFQRAMAGLAEQPSGGAGDFWGWRAVMYRFVDRLSPDDVETIAALAYAEMLEAGFTRVGEFHYLHHDRDGRPYANRGEMAERLAAAAGRTGIGLTLLPVLFAHGGVGGAPLDSEQCRFGCTVESFVELHAASRKALAPLADARLGVAPHSLRAVTPDELSAVIGLSGTGPIHLHVAEQNAEVEAFAAWSGARPVEWLLDNAAVDARWCLVHATHMNPAETARLAASEAVAGLCPITEANLGDGVFPAKAFLASGGRFGIGSDSNVRIDAAEELRLLEYGQRLTHRARGVAGSGATLFRGALEGGAQALGAPSRGLAAGEAADIVSLDGAHPGLAARSGDALLDAFVFGAGTSAIDGVWRDGVKVVSAGVHHHRDEIATAYRKALVRLLAA